MTKIAIQETLDSPATIIASEDKRAPYHSPSDKLAPQDNNLINESKFKVIIPNIEVICTNILTLESVTRCIELANISHHVNGYSSVLEWTQNTRDECLIILCSLGSAETHRVIEHDLLEVMSINPKSKVIIISDLEQSHQISRSLEIGAKGFIGMSSTFEIVLAAIRLVWAGGQFIPVSSLGGAGPMVGETSVNTARGGKLTQRELEIIKCIRRGERNKIIAATLNIKESTVGVHIRNIMRKLEAKNRTDLSLKAKQILD
ncbi:DNA-binding response regulator [Labrys portucalensis]|uniref:DNA-binding response regulator n=1 Tax=Labrys neptuniae TaxID=376174 RepID=A0ABV6ZS48_9HYPH